MNGDFPRMIYHIVEDPIVVRDEQELDRYLKQGWAKTPVVFNEINALKAKIAYHESEAQRLKSVLAIVEKNLGPEPEIEKRHPGRPKKGDDALNKILEKT